MHNGLFITFEGGEGAGKTTLIEEISRRLSEDGLSVLKVREPGGTPLGEKIRDLLLHGGSVSPYAELCLFLASRAQHVAQVIEPALKEKKVVLCDRFNDSTIAYQGAARGLGVQSVAQMCEFVSQKVQPTLTFYLDIDPELGLQRAMKRREADRIESETIAFHRKIREAFHHLHRQNPQRIRCIDATQPPDAVASQAMEILEPLLKRHYV